MNLSILWFNCKNLGFYVGNFNTRWIALFWYMWISLNIFILTHKEYIWISWLWHMCNIIEYLWFSQIYLHVSIIEISLNKSRRKFIEIYTYHCALIVYMNIFLLQKRSHVFYYFLLIAEILFKANWIEDYSKKLEENIMSLWLCFYIKVFVLGLYLLLEILFLSWEFSYLVQNVFSLSAEWKPKYPHYF